MKVSELIAGATFTPGAARLEDPPPRVTVILPAFSRGDSGWLERAINSLLGQSFADLEVIVVDDASTDSTAEVLAEAMRRDPRVSVIRHAHNIGLPAVSEYEAYVLARGDLIAFAFDDTVFYPDALATLVRASEEHPDALISGHVTAFHRSQPDGEVFSLAFGKGARESDFLAANPIPNSGLLAPRAVLDAVGLYDPHVTLARNCDYDLWQRARRRFPIVFVPECLGEEHGTASGDSLGLTYPLDHWAADDRMRQRRGHLLTPDAFPDLDVFDVAGYASAKSRGAVRELVEGHVLARPWMQPATAPAAAPALAPRVLVLAHPINASTQLAFEGLRDVAGLHVRMVDPAVRPMSELAGADVLVIARRLHDCEDWVRFARRLGIPAYLYLDADRPPMAAGDGDAHSSREFAIDADGDELASLAGVLASTEALARSIREQGLHTNVAALELAVPAAVAEWRRPPRPEGRPPTFALVPGAHRLPAFRDVVLPALLAAAGRTTRGLVVVVPGSPSEALGDTAAGELVEFRSVPASADYFAAARTLRDVGIDAVLAPPSSAARARFEAPHPLLTAAILGAALVAPAAEPYLALSEEPGVTLVDGPDSVSAWTEALCAILDAIPPGAGLPTAGAPATVSPQLLATRFDASLAAERLLAAIGDRLPAREPGPLQRALAASEWLALEVALHRVPSAGSVRAGFVSGGAVASDVPSDLTTGLYRVVRRSVRLNALRVRRTPLSLPRDVAADAASGGMGVRRWERLELSAPLGSVPFVGHRVTIRRGSYRAARAIVWADGAPGSEIGLEVVGPEGGILFQREAALPASARPVEVTFDVSGFTVDARSRHEVRIFSRSSQLVFLLERVNRSPLGLGPPRVRPMVEFDLE